MLKKMLFNLYKKAEQHKENNLKSALSELPANKTLLDVGCWDGQKTLIWAKANKAKTVLGIELDRNIVKQTRKRGIKTFIVDVNHEKWPLQNNSVDCVLSNLVIEHLTNVDHFIKESYRVTKKGGYTIVSTNNLASWHNIFSLIFGWAPFDMTNCSPKIWSLGNPLVLHQQEKPFYSQSYCHKCIYTTYWLKKWYELYGFKFIKVYASGYYPLPNFFGQLDKTHAAFITLVFKK